MNQSPEAHNKARAEEAQETFNNVTLVSDGNIY